MPWLPWSRTLRPWRGVPWRGGFQVRRHLNQLSCKLLNLLGKLTCRLRSHIPAGGIVLIYTVDPGVKLMFSSPSPDLDLVLPFPFFSVSLLSVGRVLHRRMHQSLKQNPNKAPEMHLSRQIRQTTTKTTVSKPIAARMCCRRIGEACIILTSNSAEFLNQSDSISPTLMPHISKFSNQLDSKLAPKVSNPTSVMEKWLQL